ncbi:MAG: hypothetical protein WBQ08_16115 [Candidatus Sulfotelmatobacter sp.]
MSTEASPSNNPHGHGSFEREDLSAAGVLYFIVGVAALCLVVFLVAVGFYKLLDERAGKEQPPVSPLATNVPKDTRDLPEGYKNYLKDNFPAPRLEIDERTDLNVDRIAEEERLNSYGYVDDSHVTVRIPIERAMDLIAQRGLPVRSEAAAPDAETRNATQPKETAKKRAKKGSSQ